MDGNPTTTTTTDTDTDTDTETERNSMTVISSRNPSRKRRRQPTTFTSCNVNNKTAWPSLVVVGSLALCCSHLPWYSHNGAGGSGAGIAMAFAPVVTTTPTTSSSIDRHLRELFTAAATSSSSSSSSSSSTVIERPRQQKNQQHQQQQQLRSNQVGKRLQKVRRRKERQAAAAGKRKRAAQQYEGIRITSNGGGDGDAPIRLSMDDLVGGGDPTSNRVWNIPPWLERYYDLQDDNSDKNNEKHEHDEAPSLFPSQPLQTLQASLGRNGFSSEDVQEITETMVFYYSSPASSEEGDDTTSRSPATETSTALLLGMIDFVSLILQEHSHFQSLGDDENNDNDDDPQQQPQMHMDVFASKPVILAGIVHYAECMAARQDGIYDFLLLQTLMMDSTSTAASTMDSLPGYIPRKAKAAAAATSLLLSSSSSSSATVANRSDAISNKNTNNQHDDSAYGSDLLSSNATNWKSNSSRRNNKNNNPPTRERYPSNLPLDAKDIAASATAVKRAEILAQTFLGVGNTRRLSKDEAEGLRGLLLSSMGDWRALALRCVASLFRLEGILQQQQQQSGSDAKGQLETTYTPLMAGLRSREVVHTAQEAVLVYATLAQRLGMHQLKAKIEGKAFQILYKRQYRAVSSMYRQRGEAMRTIRSYLSSEIDGLLRAEDSFMKHIDYLQVSSRVKEPYSFWKKMLKANKAAKQRKDNLLLNGKAESKTSSWSGSRTSSLSLEQVQDGIALRVILKASKESPDESAGTTRAREKLLCYYAQHLIRKQFRPIEGEDRIKDYIQYPKPNGYQSLHYTASLTYHTGQQFPFEVQVRSEEMHRVAEYGVAAHWDYKLASVQTNHVKTKGPMFALEAAPEIANASGAEMIEANDDSTISEEGTDHVVDNPIVNDLELPRNDMDDKIDNANNNNAVSTENNLAKNGQLEYIEALVNARDVLVQERVYMFVAGAGSLTMEQGQLVILDAGSSISDALKYMQEKAPEVLVSPKAEGSAMVDDHISASREAGTRSSTSSSHWVEPTVWRNGQRARPDEKIRNGDVLLIEMS